MKISVIIPVHNASETIEACVRSFTSQGYHDLEVILVENNSTDSTYEICMDIQRQCGDVRCMRTTESGVSSARNIGLRHASGDIVGFADADDMAEKGSLSAIESAFGNHPDCSVVVTGFRKLYLDGRVVAKRFSRERGVSFRRLREYAFCNSKVSGYVVNKYWRRDALGDVAFRSDLSHGEDLHFVVGALSSNRKGRAWICSSSQYVYFQNQDSATGSPDKLFLGDGSLKLVHAIEAIREDFPLDFFSRMLARRTIFSMASSQYLRFRLSGVRREYLIRCMRKNLLFYLATLFVAPLETAKRLIRISQAVFRCGGAQIGEDSK